MDLVRYMRGLVADAVAVPSQSSEITTAEQRRALFLIMMIPGTLGAVGFAAVTLWFGAVTAGVAMLVHAGVMACGVVAIERARRQRGGMMVGFVVYVLLVVFGVSLLLGGPGRSGAFGVWAALSLCFMIMAFGRRAAAWFLAGVAVLLVLGAGIVVQGRIPAELTARAAGIVDQNAFTVMMAGNLIALLAYVFASLAYFLHQRDHAYALLAEEKVRSERLLRNVLPDSIAELLKAGAGTIAQRHDEASVLFADVADFTPLTQSMDPAEVVDVLNEMFTRFDRLVEQRGLEKIKTIGDSYMVAAGLPDARADHAGILADLAIDMLAEAGRPTAGGHRLAFRIGINSGPVVAGVIGTQKFVYDVWGDTVNTASRMQEYGLPGEVQLTEATRARIAGTFAVESRGTIDIKGKGPMPVYLLRGRREPTTARQPAAAS